MNLKTFFDRVVCINLDRRPDRWTRFIEQPAVADWPFAPIERFTAIDGQRVPPPAWWKAGPGAWGIHQSHVEILARALQDGVKSLLILEDDAAFAQPFTERVESFLAKVPDDWDALLLGGQHIKPAQPVREGVDRVVNGNRTHAHALRGAFIKEVYQHLCNYPEHAQAPGMHVDHRLGLLHESGRYHVYAPDPWLVGQADGFSDIARKRFGLRFWNIEPAPPPEKLPPFVAVIGLHRSGSSCLAGILHKLGVHMGNQLGGYDPRGGFEAAGLARICERAYPFPSTKLAIPREQLLRDLRAWITDRRREAAAKKTIAGGKYPHLCAMGDELREICGDGLRVIHIDRPIEESIQSLKKRSAKESGWLRTTDEQAETVQHWLLEHKKAFLGGKVEHLAISFSDLMESPCSEVERLCRFLGLKPTETQLDSALAHVCPVIDLPVGDRGAIAATEIKA